MNDDLKTGAGDLSLDEIEKRFDQLQLKLKPLWESIGRTDPGGPYQEPNTVVVIPSITADLEVPVPALQAYEERFLFMLFLLRQPSIRIIYVTSHNILPSIIDYYLDVLPGVIISNACKRLFLVSPQDSSPRPLTVKLLERPKILKQIRSLIPDLNQAHMVPFNTTDIERELAVRLGIPMYAADPRYIAFGTKSGSRQIFSEEGVQHPLGYEDLYSPREVSLAISKMRAKKPSIRKVIVKLNEGVSGMGNAVVDCEELPEPGDKVELMAITERLKTMQFELEEVQYESYMSKLSEGGAIVEEFIIGEEIKSPSAQLRITPLGEVQLLSTHDQMLGGPSGQSYLGAIFPADLAYGSMIMFESEKIGRRFAKEGIVGRFAIDFVVVRNPDGAWESYAIEVNLRKGGTTAPFLTLQYLTDGIFDPQKGVYVTAHGHHKCYVSSDHVESPHYRVFTPDDLFDIVSCHRIHFDQVSQTGVILNMFSAVGSHGRFGVTAIANTHEEANDLYNRFVELVDKEAKAH